MSHKIFLVPELVERILMAGPLSWIDLLTTCRGVCKTWKSIIETSPDIQYYTTTGTTEPIDDWEPLIDENQLRLRLTPAGIQTLRLFWRKLLCINIQRTRDMTATFDLMHKLKLVYNSFELPAKHIALYYPHPMVDYRDTTMQIFANAWAWGYIDRVEYQQKAFKSKFAENKELLALRDRADSLASIMFQVCSVYFMKEPQDRWEYIRQGLLSTPLDLEGEVKECESMYGGPGINMKLIFKVGYREGIEMGTSPTQTGKITGVFQVNFDRLIPFDLMVNSVGHWIPSDS